MSHHEIFEEPPTSSFLASIIDFLLRIIVMDTGKSLSEALLFAEHGENMLCTKIVRMSETISVHNMFSPVLSLEFSCIELVIQ